MKQYVASLIFLIIALFSQAQDASFSQFNASRLYANPAFAGTDSTLVISTGYRLQWANINYPYKSFYASADQYVHSMRAGIGLNYFYDSEMDGAFTKTRYEFNYSTHIELFKHKLVIKPAFQAAFIQYKIDFNKLVYGDQIDPRRGFIYETREVPGRNKKAAADFAMGMLIYSKHFFGDFVFQHITQPDVGFIAKGQLPLKLSVHTGANLFFKRDSLKKIILSPTLLFISQGPFYENEKFSNAFSFWMPGITAKYKWISLGLSYRSEDTFIITAAFMNRFLRIGYSYDYTTSALTNKVTGGSHEIQLTWYMHYQRKLCKIKTLRLI